MQEDDHRPSDDFLIELGKFLQSCGRQVPFVMPEKQPSPQPSPQLEKTVDNTQQAVDDKQQMIRAQYRKALQSKDWISAFNYKKQ